MFGYITPDIRSLSNEARSRYRKWYCGLCHELGRSYGLLKRSTLTHDMTYLAIFLSSIFESVETEILSRCPIAPWNKKRLIHTEYTEYAASMNLLLTYYKFDDDSIDEKHFPAQLGMNWLLDSVNKIKKSYPVQEQKILSILHDIHLAQNKKWQNPIQCLDSLCNLSGQLLSAVFDVNPQYPFSNAVLGMAHSLGRFIYLMDAYEDYRSDTKSGCFNPLIPISDRNDFEIFIHESLSLFLAEAVQYLEFLPIEKDLDILRNVLYSGIWLKYHHIKKKQEEKS